MRNDDNCVSERPGSQDETDGWRRGEVSVSAVLETIRRAAQKKIFSTELLIFIPFLIIINFQLYISRAEKESFGFVVAQGAKRLYDLDGFTKIESRDAYLPWLLPTLYRLYDDRGSDSVDNYYVLFLVELVQWRHSYSGCNDYKEHKFISVVSNITCPSGEWDRSPYGSKPYTARPITNPPFLQENISPRYTTERTFTVHFDFEKNRTEFNKSINDIQREWIDKRTGAIQFTSVVYNSADRFFVFVSMFLEFTVHGTVEVITQFKPFSPVLWLFDSPISILEIILDGVVSFLILVLTFQLLKRIYKAYKLENSILRALTFWELVGIINVGVFVWTTVQRISLWVRWSRVRNYNPGDDRSLIKETYSGCNGCFEMDWLYRSGVSAEVADELLSLAIASSWVRLFGLLQHHDRINSMLITIKRATGQLVGMLIVFALVLLAFIVISMALYGRYLTTFDSAGDATAQLLILVLGQYTFEEYTTMVEIHPIISPVFLLSFFFLCWLIIINLVLAILTGTFASVMEGLPNPDWSLSTISRDVLRGVNFVKRKAEGLLSKKKAASTKSRETRLTHQMKTTQAVDMMKQLRMKERKSGAYTNDEEFRVLATEMTETQRAKLLEKARNHAEFKNSRQSLERQMGTVYDALEKVVLTIGLVQKEVQDLKDIVIEKHFPANENRANRSASSAAIGLLNSIRKMRANSSATRERKHSVRIKLPEEHCDYESVEMGFVRADYESETDTTAAPETAARLTPEHSHEANYSPPVVIASPEKGKQRAPPLLSVIVEALPVHQDNPHQNNPERKAAKSASPAESTESAGVSVYTAKADTAPSRRASVDSLGKEAHREVSFAVTSYLGGHGDPMNSPDETIDSSSIPSPPADTSESDRSNELEPLILPPRAPDTAPPVNLLYERKIKKHPKTLNHQP